MNAWYQYYRSNFTPVECREIVAYAKKHYPVKKALIGHGGQAHEHGMRRSRLRWLPRTDLNLRFLFERIILNVLESNENAFGLELSDYPRLRFGSAQFTEYRAAKRGHKHDKYEWHEDCSWLTKEPRRYDRKISCVLQLSDSKDYEGGRLEFDRSDALLPEDRFTEQGDLILFPSHLRHRVTEVTKGVRHSLVLWVEGPPLR